jgi:predicted nucleotidyltransferase
MPDGFRSYVDAWRARWARDAAKTAALADRARGLVPRLAEHLRVRHGAVRVWLFGSLAWGGFTPGSDIDLAAEGLPPGRAVYRVAAELDELARPFRVEIVPIEDAERRCARRSSRVAWWSSSAVRGGVRAPGGAHPGGAG